MRKSKFRFPICAYAVVGFILAVLRLPLLCALLLVFVLVFERDEWTSRQLISSLLISVIIFIFDPVLVRVAESVALFSSSFYAMVRLLSAVIYGVAAVLCVLGILRVMKDAESRLPLVSRLSSLIYGLFKPR